MRSPSEWSLPTYFTIIFGGVIIAVLLFGASTSTTAFGAYNTAWDGTADLRAIADNTKTNTHLGQNTTAYTEVPADQTVALVIAPDEPYDQSDANRIEGFVREGGTLVVADERARPTNRLLADLGTEARINGTLLRDERQYYRAPSAPIVRNLSTSPVFMNVRALTLNHGSSVDPGNATVLARTSGYAYLDTNGNNELDETETVTEYPVLTTEQLGEGRVIVVGDASFFINDMLKRPGNKQFVRNLVVSHTHLLLDYSHTVSLPPLVQVMFTLRKSPPLRFITGGIGILLLALYTTRHEVTSLWKDFLPASESSSFYQSLSETSRTPNHTPDLVAESDLVDYLRTQYPEWDEERLRRIVTARRAESLDEDSVISGQQIRRRRPNHDGLNKD